MKKTIYALCSVAAVIYSIYYASLGGFRGNSGALSKIGLSHPVLFIIWGAITVISLFILICAAYSKTQYKFHKYLLIISFLGMLLTIFFDFDYNEKVQYYLHCSGSLTFSVVTGITVLLLFYLTKRYILAGICLAVLITDFILLLIFKETALIELFPIFSGYILLNIFIFKLKEKKLGVKQNAQIS